MLLRDVQSLGFSADRGLQGASLAMWYDPCSRIWKLDTKIWHIFGTTEHKWKNMQCFYILVYLLGRVGSRGQQGGAETKSGHLVPPRVYLVLSSGSARALSEQLQ